MIQKEIFFEGFEELFTGLVPREDVAFSHNDVQRSNVLFDGESLVLIDFEYAGWNPRAYDLANFINECAVDLAHPFPPGIKYYPSNFPSQ